MLTNVKNNEKKISKFEYVYKQEKPSHKTRLALRIIEE